MKLYCKISLFMRESLRARISRPGSRIFQESISPNCRFWARVENSPSFNFLIKVDFPMPWGPATTRRLFILIQDIFPIIHSQTGPPQTMIIYHNPEVKIVSKSSLDWILTLMGSAKKIYSLIFAQKLFTNIKFIIVVYDSSYSTSQPSFGYH